MTLGKGKLLIVCSRNRFDKTKYIIEEIRKGCQTSKILFLSLECGIDDLKNEFMLDLDSKNLKVVDTFITIEEIKDYINSNNPDIVYIDYIQLVGGATHIKNFKTQQQFILQELSNYALNFNTEIVVLYLISYQRNNDELLEELKQYKVSFLEK